MRQVPEISKSQFLIIGSGRLARHLQHYFQLSNINFLSWDRSQDPHLLKTLVRQSTHVLLAISDKALVSFFETHLEGFDLKVIHFSGALHHPRLISAHPLMSFSENLFSFAEYKKIHFTLCGAESLAEALPGLSNPFSLIRSEDKALYHALCVVAGNFSNLLWQKSWEQFIPLNIPFSAFENYLQQTLNNFASARESSLTGPLVREDQATMLANLQALPPPLRSLYLEFTKIYSEKTFAQLQKEISL